MVFPVVSQCISPLQRFGFGARETKRKALLIGINYLHQQSELYGSLSGPIDDVKVLRDTLITYHGFKEKDVTVMTDEEKDPKNRKMLPTKANIIKAIQALVQDARPGDVFVFHYAGHTDQRKAINDSNEKDGLDEVLITSDLEQIVDDDLHKLLVRPLPEGSRLTAIFDSCHSGTLLDLLHYECNCSEKRRGSTCKLPFVGPPSPGVAQTCFRIRALTLDIGYIRRGQKYLRSRGSKLRTKVRGTMRSQTRGSKVEPIGTESSNPPTSSSQTRCGPHCRFERRSGPIVISISSCADHQFSWEVETSDGASSADQSRSSISSESNGSMTKALARVLQTNPAVTVTALKKKIDEALFRFACIKHVEAQKWVHEYGDTLTREQREELNEALKFEVQLPQIGSLSHLRGDEVFIMGRPGHDYSARKEFQLRLDIRRQ
ncbi:uncharacterized protein STEHIDRAFT_109568 [Stereum hirsutum FP-91666 SS1]|uniref:uncharacterized protein n=1 Tax=Stereum hirsutum (strain FP-91666) TaxID=721885 RepID=UPI000440CE6A|nr:uncharacterized protein STEHIDRAFT_109568 [Stereum hirsutum FP-91666 SS1]EIM89370.1 hypothetical protein STEHIDRAFT_109568 [Stereum hirsutum FP-91666 SS1]